MVEAQKQQMQALKMRLDVEGKDLKQNQTKKSMEDAKVIQLVSRVKAAAPYLWKIPILQSPYTFYRVDFSYYRTRASRRRRSAIDASRS